MSLYIATLNEVKQNIGIQDSQDDQVLTRWLEGLQARVDDHLKIKLLRGVNVEEIHDGGHLAGKLFIYLDRIYIESISTVHISSAQTWDSTTLMPPDAYRLIPRAGKIGYGLHGITCWPQGIQNIRVVYTGGFLSVSDTIVDDEYPMPDGIRRAFLMQAEYEWRNRENFGKESVSVEGFSISMAKAQLLPEVKEGLRPWKRIL